MVGILRLEDLQKHFKKRGKKANEHYSIWTEVEVRYTSGKMEIRWTVLKSKTGEALFTVEGAQKVWDGSRSEFTRDEAEVIGGTGIA